MILCVSPRNSVRDTLKDITNSQRFTLTSRLPIIFIILVTVGNSGPHSKHVTSFKQIPIGLKTFPCCVGFFSSCQKLMCFTSKLDGDKAFCSWLVLKLSFVFFLTVIFWGSFSIRIT